MKKLNEDLIEAQKTIKLQSDAIFDAEDGSKPHSTPQRYCPSAGVYSQVYDQPPPAYNASSNRFTR